MILLFMILPTLCGMLCGEEESEENGLSNFSASLLTSVADRSGERKSGIGAELRFDEVYHFPEGAAQDGVVVPHFREITAWVMLCPELIGQAVREVFERGESSIKIHCLGNERTQIVDSAQLPTTGNQVCFQKPLGSLLQQFNHRLIGPLKRMEQVCGMQTSAGGPEPIRRTVFVCFQMSTSPLLTISSWKSAP